MHKNIMLYKIMSEIANALNKEICISADVARTRSKHGHKLCIITKNTNEYKYSFFHKLSAKILVDSETVDTFKNGLKNFKSPC